MEKKSLSNSFHNSLNIFNDPKHSFSGQASESFIFLILDCFSYTAGEKVTGEILLNIEEPIKDADLKIQSKGSEEVQVFGYKDRSQKIHEQQNEIYNLDSTLNKWEELGIGQYVFPFNFKLPAYCPATFAHSGEDELGNYIKAEVFYSVTVKFEINKGPSLSHSRMVHIKNAQNLEKPGPSIEETVHLVGCCFNKGSTSFKLSVSNTDHCQVDGDLKYKLFPNNLSSKSPINQIIGSVMLDFEISTKKGVFKIIKKISEANRATWISSFTNQIYEKDFEYFSDLKVSSDELNPSSNKSVLIKCVYYIECMIFYDIFCMKYPVVIRLPFHVNPKINYRKETPSLPKNWNPIESPIYSLIVSSTTQGILGFDASLNIKT